MTFTHGPKEPVPLALRLAIVGTDPKLKLWYETIALRSRVTADMYVGSLARLLEYIGLTAEEAVADASSHPDEFAARMVRYATAQRKKGLLDATVSKSFNGLRSYFKHRRVGFASWPELRPIQGASLEKERVPRPEELGIILEHLNLRGRCAALLMAHAGLRPAVLGSYRATAGLTLDALVDFDIRTLSFREIPFAIRVPADLSKTRVAYTTFGTEQLGRVITAYLTERRADGEKLAGKSPVIAHSPDARGVAVTALAATGSKFMTTGAIMRDLRDAIEKCRPTDVTWRPYVLRAYCSTRLLLAEGDGRISRDLREAILGHTGDGVASRYNVGKRWGEELLAEARREYANASEFLETNPQSRVNVAAEFRRTLLAVAGLSEEEAAKHVNDSNEELLAILREKLTGHEAASTSPANGNGNAHGVQRPVTIEEAEALLAQGWTYVANFGPNRVILQAP